MDDSMHNMKILQSENPRVPTYRHQTSLSNRGWTLQELIAPASVDFFSKEGELLGSKASLERHICEITGIPVNALRGSPLSDFSVTERMLWAASRETYRQEDKAYSLLGIFDVNMPLIYSEGKDKALQRLREEIDKASKGRSFSFVINSHQDQKVGFEVYEAANYTRDSARELLSRLQPLWGS